MNNLRPIMKEPTLPAAVPGLLKKKKPGFGQVKVNLKAPAPSSLLSRLTGK